MAHGGQNKLEVFGLTLNVENGMEREEFERKEEKTKKTTICEDVKMRASGRRKRH